MSDDLDELFDFISGKSKKCTKCALIKPLLDFNKGGSQYGLSSWCRECEKLHHKINSVRIKAQRKEYRADNKDNTKAYNKQWYDQNLKPHKDKRKNKHLKHYYDLTIEQFNSMLEAQNGKCKVCGDVLDGGKGTHVDHDHKTSKIRGILCHPCNTKLGWYEKNAEKVDKYLAENTSDVDVKLLIPSYAFLH